MGFFKEEKRVNLKRMVAIDVAVALQNTVGAFGCTAQQLRFRSNELWKFIEIARYDIGMSVPRLRARISVWADQLKKTGKVDLDAEKARWGSVERIMVPKGGTIADG